MAVKPFRKCPVCGTYNTLDKDICGCGQHIRTVIPNMVDEEEAARQNSLTQSGSKKGKMEDETASKNGDKSVRKDKEDIAETEGKKADEKQLESAPISGQYKQECPACRKVYILSSKEERKKRCESCGKARIGLIEPTLLETAGETENPKGDSSEASAKIKTEDTSNLKESPKSAHPNPLVIASVPPYVGCRCSFTWEEAPITIGRYATLGDFLEQDGRVSGEHCTFSIEDGAWCVKDEHSTNSTLLDNRKVSDKTPVRLKKGSRLTLGNRLDSMEFEIESI